MELKRLAAAAVIIIFRPRSKRFIIYDNAERSGGDAAATATTVEVHHYCLAVAAAMPWTGWPTNSSSRDIGSIDSHKWMFPVVT